MALSLTMSLSNPNVVANVTTNAVIAVTNTNATSVTLNSLVVFETTESDAVISQPVFYTPNVAPGVGNPVLLPNTTVYFPFQVLFNSPGFPGPSPQNQPGGANPGQVAFPADPNFVLQATAVTSDGSVFGAAWPVAVLSTIAPYPLAQGGAFQFSQGANLVNLLTTGL